MHLDLELLETFVAIVDGNGFTRAAERLHKTQSTISQQLKRLEERVGAALLTRNTRGLALTPEGELLLGYARRLSALHADAIAALASARVEGRVRMGAAQDVADGGLRGLLSHFSARHPGISIELRVEANRRLREHVGSGELDLAVVMQTPGEGGESIGRLECVWVAPPGFVAPPVGEPLPLVLFDAPCLFRDTALAALERAGMPWRVALTTPSLAGLRAAVLAGLGVTVRTTRWLEADAQILRESDGLPRLPEVELVLLTPDAAPDVATTRLLESVREAMRASGRDGEIPTRDMRDEALVLQESR
ncbi:MAG: LysR substrate-binding domain-containing protein [Chromatiales bacterium]|jgi:DNA-binding transcriptional LysR family regulator|nr:LysR substrate-binding domain-containing protein [Chromatiales bacterium]MDX9766950.1 LysR substrate-binding domain-containing protein [Ectothiorhodospiraceae bacterium]